MNLQARFFPIANICHCHFTRLWQRQYLAMTNYLSQIFAMTNDNICRNSRQYLLKSRLDNLKILRRELYGYVFSIYFTKPNIHKKTEK